MKNIVIIPISYNYENLDLILDAYNKQTILPYRIIIVSNKKLNIDTYNNLSIENILIDIDKNGFFAGLYRDTAVKYIMNKNYDFDNLIFTDGDCVPSKKLIEEHEKNLKLNNLSCGIRYFDKYHDKNIKDEREILFYKNKNRNVIHPHLILGDTVVFSCNLAIDRKTMKDVIKINNKLSNDNNRLFNSEFDGCWGLEDNFLGIVVFKLYKDISLVNTSCNVQHIIHKSQRKSVSRNRSIMNKLVRKLNKYCKYTIVERNKDFVLPYNYNDKEYFLDVKNLYLPNKIRNIVKSIDFYKLKEYFNYSLLDLKNICSLQYSRNIKVKNGNGEKYIYNKKLDNYFSKLSTYLMLLDVYDKNYDETYELSKKDNVNKVNNVVWI